jgi:predicted transcriptional regulator
MENPPREKEVEQLALETLQQANIQAEPPVDVMALATQLKTRVYEARFNRSISGVVYTDPRKIPEGVEPGIRATIFINTDHPKTRQRFTLAHELGHLQLGHAGIGIRWRAEGMEYNSTEEYEANVFAAAVLMPQAPFCNAMYMQQGDLVKVALTFGVSVEAASIRANRLGLLDWRTWNQRVNDERRC